MDYTQLITRLRIESEFDDTTTGNEGADAIEALQSEVEMWKATANAVVDFEKVELRKERDALQARVLELEAELGDLPVVQSEILHDLKVMRKERDAALAKLAALEGQEPVAWMRKDGDLIGASEKRPDYAYTHYYDRPLYFVVGAQAQPLTDEQIDKCVEVVWGSYADFWEVRQFTREIEKAHGIGGSV
jgi:hypothetical protein